MKALELTEKHKIQLLEMCKALFPKYKNIQFGSGIGDCGGWSYDFLYCENNERNTILSIHWFEFCLFQLSEKISKKLYYPADLFDITHTRKMLIENVYRIHPVDYLYQEFKKI